MNDDGLEPAAVSCFHDDIAGIEPVAEDEKQDHAGKIESGPGNWARGLFGFGHLDGGFDLCTLGFTKYRCHQQADDHCKNYGPHSPSDSDG